MFFGQQGESECYLKRQRLDEIRLLPVHEGQIGRIRLEIFSEQPPPSRLSKDSQDFYFLKEVFTFFAEISGFSTRNKCLFSTQPFNLCQDRT